MPNSSIFLIDRTLSVATTPDESATGGDDNEGVFPIPKSSRITESLPSDCLVSYLGHSLGEFYSPAGMQSVYSAAPADLPTNGSIWQGSSIPRSGNNDHERVLHTLHISRNGTSPSDAV